MPRPPYRWKSLWAGILILALLTCAWTKSMSETLLWTPWEKSSLSITSGNGALDLFLLGDTSLALEKGLTHLTLDPDSRHWFPAPVKSYTDPTGKGISIAYWLIILLIFDTWLICLFLRWWRRKR